MTASLESPPPEQKKEKQEPTVESPVEAAYEMTREGTETGIGAVHETAKQAVDELEGMIKDLTDTREEPPQKKPEKKEF